MSNRIGVIVHPGWTIHKDKLFDEYKDFVKDYKNIIIVPVLLSRKFAKVILDRLPLKTNMGKGYDYYYNVEFINNIVNDLKKMYFRKYKKIKHKSKRKKDKRSYVVRISKVLRREEFIERLLTPNIIGKVFNNTFNGTVYEDHYETFLNELKEKNPDTKFYSIELVYPNLAGKVIGELISGLEIDEVVFTGENLNQCVLTAKNNFELISDVDARIDDSCGVYYKGDINEV